MMEHGVSIDKMYEISLELYKKSREWNDIVSEIRASSETSDLLSCEELEYISYCGEIIRKYSEMLRDSSMVYRDNEKTLANIFGG